MRTARPLGLSPDGTSLIVALEGGEQVTVPVDDRLRAALRNDRARMGQLEIEMESALRPRDIQARIRAGETLESVAQAAGVPSQQIEPFAAPVIAEREHIAGLAQANPVRRAGDAVAHRSLRAVVTDRLLSRGVDVDTVDWDAWRNEDRRWTVRLSYESGSAHRQADFTYDQTGRFSLAANDDARWLTGEHSSSHGPQPGRRRPQDSDDESTADLNDELAIVRAIQPQFAVTPDIDDELDEPDRPDDLDDENSTPDNEDAFAEGDLAEVNGVYDIIPGDRSNMDVLYDMLSSFDEDSVQIYAGLVRPAPDEAAAPVIDPGAGNVEAIVVETVSVIEVLPQESVTDDEDRLPDDEQGGEAVVGVDHTDDPAGAEAHGSEPPRDAGASDDVDDDEFLDDDDDESLFAEVPIVHPVRADVPLLTEPDDDDGGLASPVEAEAITEVIEPAQPHHEPVGSAETATPPPSEPVGVSSHEGTDDNATPGREPAGSSAHPSDPPQPEQPEQPAEPPRRPTGRRRPVTPAATEPEQPRLVDEAGAEPSRPIRRKRASVPSWDEIMFGAPAPRPDQSTPTD